MNINELKGNGNTNDIQEDELIINPNLIKKTSIQSQSKESRQVEVTPEELGFKHREVEDPKNDIFDALDKLDEVIDKKEKEAQLMGDLIDINDGVLTEEEFREEIGEGYVTDYLDDASELEDKYPNPKYKDDDDNEEDNTEEYVDEVELDNEIFDDEEDLNMDDYNINEEVKEDPIEESIINPNAIPISKTEETSSTTGVKPISTDINQLAFPEDEFGDNEEDIESESTSEEEKEKKSDELLRMAVIEKIKPSKVVDFNKFKISKRPISFSSTITSIEGPQKHIANWVLMSTGVPVMMRGFTGTELEKLNNPGGLNQSNTDKIRFKMMYDHIVDDNKPSTVEEWAQCISYSDINDLWFAIFKSCFDGSNFLPYNCTNTKCGNAFLSDDLDIMDLVKFKDNKARDRFNKIYNTESDKPNKFYNVDVLPISDSYAFGLKEPSIYNAIFEVAQIDEKFTEKYKDVINILTYIDEIYFIRANEYTLSPVDYRRYPSNPAKDFKSKVTQYSKVIKTLSSDQYYNLIAEINKIVNNGYLTYQVPAITCPKCGAKIPASEMLASSMVFSRHQLAVLAAL